MTSPLKGTYFLTRDLGDHIGEMTFRVTVDYYPGRPGKMYLRNGDPGYPDDPPEIDIKSLEWSYRGGWVEVGHILAYFNPDLCNSLEDEAINLAMEDDWEDNPEERDDDPWVREEL